MSFEHLGLGRELLEAVKSRGYTTPTPIQNQAIPVILAGRDILARAQTGTGKTDAFALPLVHLLSREAVADRFPRALVIVPTRELALQVGESIKFYARRVSLRCTVVFGGVRLAPQIDRLHRGVDILVATPGRLLDLAGRGHLDLSRIGFLVFDEADRMLDLGFSDAISQINSLIPRERRTLLFSATFSHEIRTLAQTILNHPEHIEVSPEKSAAELVLQRVYRVLPDTKRDLFIQLVTQGNWKRVLVFTKTKHGANTLTEKLNLKGISSAALHGNMSQSLRIRTLEEFKGGEIRILVATDVAARGLDITNLPYVVNYDMPRTPEDYVHRIGRTGRAGEKGVAVSLVTPADTPSLSEIEHHLKQKIPVKQVDGYTKGRGVPDFVLYRPGDKASEKGVDKDIIEIVKRRTAAKEKARARKTKSKGRGKRQGSPNQTARRKDGAGKQKSRPSRNKPRGK